MSLTNSFAPARKARAPSCPHSFFFICRTITPTAPLPGKPRPAATVADNDLAVGRVVEAVSHSPYWDDTAIFMLEDDAQDGADHVDAHRSIAFVISKYSPGSADHPFVDHHFYTTVNMIHTMETLAGFAADESERRLCAGDGAAVFRCRRSAAIHGRLEQSR